MKVYLTVDKDGTECVFDYKPEKRAFYWLREEGHVELPKGTIKKLIGKQLTWEDEPYEWEGEEL